MPRQQLHTAVRIDAVDERPQHLGLNDTLQTERGSPASLPHAGGFTRAHVVVLHPVGHRHDQILGTLQLRDRQHDPTTPGPATPQGWQVPAVDGRGFVEGWGGVHGCGFLVVVVRCGVGVEELGLVLVLGLVVLVGLALGWARRVFGHVRARRGVTRAGGDSDSSKSSSGPPTSCSSWHSGTRST